MIDEVMETLGKRLMVLDVIKLKQKAKEHKEGGRRARRKLRVLIRDKYKCTNCGSKENLTIAHIAKTRGIKHRNSASYPLRLCKTLCERCHVYEDKYFHTPFEVRK